MISFVTTALKLLSHGETLENDLIHPRETFLSNLSPLHHPSPLAPTHQGQSCTSQCSDFPMKNSNLHPRQECLTEEKAFHKHRMHLGSCGFRGPYSFTYMMVTDMPVGMDQLRAALHQHKSQFWNSMCIHPSYTLRVQISRRVWKFYSKSTEPKSALSP